MTTLEKVAYLKGLCDGMKLDTEKDEGKIIKGLLDILEDVAEDIEDLDERINDLSEEVDELSDDLESLEEDVESLEDEVFDGECDCECCCGDDDDDDEPMFFDIICHNCKKEITVDEDVLDLGEIKCPGCGEKIEFNFEFEDEDDDEE